VNFAFSAFRHFVMKLFESIFHSNKFRFLMSDQELILPTDPPPPDAAEFRPSVLARALFLYTGVILPAICFSMGFPDQPDWQSGKAMAFAQLYLSHKGSMPFYPCLLYNMASMSLLVFKPKRFAAKVWVRFGVYSGVAVAVGFWGLFVLTSYSGPPRSIIAQFFTAFFFSLLGIIVPWAIVYGLHFSLKKYDWTKWIILILIVICILGIVYLFIFSLLCSTPWAVAAYAAMSFMIIRHRKEKGFQFSLAQLLGFVTWFGGYCATWRVAYLIVLEEYSKLPTDPPPQCYLCTAAARGHRRWVRSEEHFAADGRKFRVNDQLRRFKAFELFLIAVCPRMHRLCRWIYDLAGPVLARTIVHPIIADIAYAALKPPEWICQAVLFCTVRDSAAYRKLYRF
jgi:hypothetical protein